MSGARVLVVDDDRANRTLLGALLEQAGYGSHAVPDGGAALAVLAAEPFHAVLLDLLMPGVGGLDVLAAMKADSRLSRIPVLVISGAADTGSIVRCLELGAEDFVSKPFDPAVLRARISAALARHGIRELEGEYAKVLAARADEIAALRARVDACTCDPRTATGP